MSQEFTSSKIIIEIPSKMKYNKRNMISTLEQIMLLWYFVDIISAFGVISHITLNANLSSFPLNEHKFELSKSGTMSIL